jgi:hypothetical protein
MCIADSFSELLPCIRSSFLFQIIATARLLISSFFSQIKPQFIDHYLFHITSKGGVV